MEVIKGEKEKKETIKAAEEIRNKVGFAVRNKDVLIDELEIKPKSKIALPSAAKVEDLMDFFWEYPYQGVVVDIGPLVDPETSGLTIGCKVALRHTIGRVPVRDKGYTYYVYGEYDIIGILE